MTIDAESFKAGMRHLAGHVCLVTTLAGDGRRAGITATAVCSVSADPPTLLFCVNRNSGSYPILRAAGVFAVNVLATEDRALAMRFAGPLGGEARFEVGDWIRLHTGAPVLASALASFDCHLTQAVEVGTHDIFFGEIEAAQVAHSRRRPLLYAHGSYGHFADLEGGG